VAQTEYRQVPPIRDFLVHGHWIDVVDIRLFGEWATSMSLYIFAVVEQRMCKGCGDGSKRDAVGNSERRGKGDGAIGLAGLEFEALNE
jgi:hypothetical protein